MNDVTDYENFFSLPALLQRFHCLFILLSILLCKPFSMQETTPVYFSEYHEGGIQAASSSTAQKATTKHERAAKRLQGFQLCFPVLKVTWLGWRIYTNTKSFAPPSAERVMACANRM